ncbi:MAG: hypothetical protein QF903_02525 [Planctomycetota bacterium]|jgi:hypothetical protein|nr:hypothetical protein [Planctomycetota bacterium]MDP6762799.1 hypothetical protein [Planctomycetota bacterium]MDP6988336.1 hypothetical protein [Planctomycetota bacterium]
MRRSIHFAIAALLLSMAVVWLRVPGRIDAGTAVRMDIPELVDQSDLVFEGRVLERDVRQDSQGRIETTYRISVERTFWGPDQLIRRVRVPGGVLADGRGLLLPGMPEIAVGEDVLLFLSRPGSTGIRVPVGLAQGKFRVLTDRDGRRRLVRDQSDLSLVDPATGRIHEAGARAHFDYAETAAAIHAAAVSRKARIARGEERR